MKKKKAFTLAEVLITLGIIGIVAAMTLPTIIQKHREKVAVAKVKKIYSIASQAFMLAVEDKGTPDLWNLIANGNSVGAENLAKVFAEYMKVIKFCGVQVGCLKTGMYKNLNGQSNNTDFNNNKAYSKMILSDGAVIVFVVRSPDCSSSIGETPQLKNVCGRLYIDINGSQSPNQYGHDFFAFHITKQGIIPAGTKAESDILSFSSCNINSTGYGCAAWVIFNENMDYLHCNDLSWDGKHSCK